MAFCGKFMRWLQLINVNSYKLFYAKPQLPKIPDLNKHLEYQYYIAPLGGYRRSFLYLLQIYRLNV